jgi:ADP-dependent NAD(P)H-hydrate dehydratase / NAD(P)H-hydrate epimerase
VIPLFLSSQIREADNIAVNQVGFPGVILMENAAIEIFNNIKNSYPGFSPSVKIGVICGKGNNGGDGFAVARHFLNNGNEVVLLHLNNIEELTDDANANFTILTQYKILSPVKLKLKKLNSAKDVRLLADCGIVIDAILGSGSAGVLNPLFTKIVDELNLLSGFKVAIDIPTGLGANTGYGETVFNADVTVTLGELKRGLFFADGYKYCGKIIKGNIGIPPAFFDQFEVDDYLIEPEDALYFLPVKGKAINKYSSGKVLNVSGSGKYSGAAILASKAAFKAGAGALLLAFPQSVRNLISRGTAEIVFDFYPDNGEECLTEEGIKNLSEKINWADCVLIGPGLGRSDSTVNAVRSYLKSRKNKRTIIDADAIFAIGKKEYKKYDLSGTVLTPHMGEFANLTGVEVSEIEKDILKYGKAFAEETGAFLVLKGAPTIIFNPDGEAFVNAAGNPGMAKFGSGDALSGIIAAFAAQKENTEEAVISAVYLHSLSADMLLKQYSEFGFTATNIIDNFPKSIIFLRNSFV